MNGTAIPSNKWGWAVTFGLRLNFPMIGPGDYFQAQVVYAQGASQYASNTPGAFLVKQGRRVWHQRRQ